MVKKNKNKVTAKVEENIKKIEDGFILLTPYKSILDDITAECKECGNVETKTARSYIRSGCTECKKIERIADKLEGIRKEDEEYLERVNRSIDDRVNEYKISHEREYEKDILELTHVPCGKVEKIENRYKVPVCSECHKDRLIDADWYREMYPKLKADGYEVIGVHYGPYSESKSRTTNIEFLHKECGNKYTRISHTAKLPGGYLCPICHIDEGKRIGAITEDNIDQMVKAELGDEYEYAGRFTDSSEPFDIRHKVCGTVYSKRLSAIREGTGVCLKCEGVV